MKRILTLFFVALGVMFFIIILIAIYLFVADPYNLKPIFFGSSSEIIQEQATEQAGEQGLGQTGAEVIDKNPALNASQERVLETFGVDPANVPTAITAEQEACFVEVLGVARVEEIKAGDTPSAIEFFRAKDCI